ncbi:MAG: uridine phosphorylase [Candidatus Wallbacteria bacterium HGW-Wallbacteria-1]|jgi:uridine phosphorylase|uniref:Uridine phosphorylase n=1 Tax=Candidatus Wallbacteria bacterium HGW-Wallbacteria-1 TaxID=2013854 RepID=A0A2N1PLX0_9BACT|nr:MAG: uridine phosphorylase [Candidatus Wallbacteria bacterium HGW-Wallbacteria-1]
MNDELQYHIHLKKGDIGRYVILPGDPGRVPKIAQFFDNPKEIAFNREYRTFVGTVDGIQVACTSTGIGCPSAAICIEELIKIGADTFIRVGTAGSLQENVGLGDLTISMSSVREEGTSRQYVPLAWPSTASFEVTSALKQAADKLGFTAHVGVTHCKDAFYTEGSDGEDLPLREHNRQMWEAWRKVGVLSTSMESAALFTVGAIRRVHVGEITATIGLTWNDQPIAKKVGVEDAIKTAIEAVRIIEGWRREGKMK